MFKRFIKRKNPKIQEYLHNANFREVISPVKMRDLWKFPPHVERIQFSSSLKETDFQILGKYFEEKPKLQLRVCIRDSVENLDFLKYFPGVKKFSCDVWNLETLDGIEYLPGDLEYFGFGQTKKKSHSLKFLRRFPGLKRLFLDGHKRDIEVVGEMPILEKLDLRSITLPNLEMFSGLETLWWFTLKLGGTKNLKALPDIGNLKYLELWRIRGLEDISMISEITSLKFLFLQTLNRITELPDFSRNQQLKQIHLQANRNITDLSPLLTANALESLEVYEMHHLKAEDFECLLKHPRLTRGRIGLRNNVENEKVKAMFNWESPGFGPRNFPFSKE